MATWLLLQPLAATAVNQAQKGFDYNRYLPMQFISGIDSELKLYINRQSLNLDLSRTNNIRVRLKAKELFNSIERVSSFTIKVYDVTSGERQFISSQNVTVGKQSKTTRLVSLNAGHFEEPSKLLEIEVIDTARNLVNTYSTQVTASNLDSQIAEGESVTRDPADCDPEVFDECQLDYIFQRMVFEARPQKQVSTRVTKGEDGLYKISIPVPKTRFDPLKEKVKHLPRNGKGGDGAGGITINFGEILNISSINVGSSAANSFKISQRDGDLIFGDEKVFFDTTGKIGVGVTNPNAWVHIAAGSSDSPSIIMNPGTLSTTARDGGLEYDGNRFYLTANGTRSAIPLITDPSGRITMDMVSGDFVFREVAQVVTNKTLHNTILNGNIRIPENAVNGWVLRSDRNGFAKWIDPQSLALYDSNNGTEIKAIGKKIKSDGDQAMVIGYGNSPTDKLVNSTNSSLMIGFDSNRATLFVGPSNNGNTIGRVGIGNTNPDALLEIGNGIPNFIDGTSDLLVGDDIEVDGTIFTQFANGVTANFANGNFNSIVSTLGNITTVNSSNINVSGTVNGANFDGDFTNGSVIFSNVAGVLSENNSQFYWSSVTNRLGIGNNNPSQKLDVNGQVRIRGGNPNPNYVLSSLDTAGNGQWMDISVILTNGGAFLNALNDAISDKNYNLFLGNGAGLDATGRRNTGVGIHALHTVNIGNGNTAFGFSALNQLTNGHSNLAIGDRAGIGMIGGNGNIFIGNVNGSSATASNELNIGDAIFGNLANGNIGIGIQNPNNFKLQVVGNIGPQTDSTYDLGSSTIRWANVFADNFNGADANITTINNTTINSTTGNIDTINSLNINNSVTITSNSFNGVMANISGTVNGANFDGDFTNGSILFSNAAGEIVENNSSLYWSSTTERLGIGTNDPSQSIDTTGRVRIRGGNPNPNYVLSSLDTAGNGQWMDISVILTNGGAFLNALNDAISDNNYNLFLGNGAGLVATGRYNTGLGIDTMRTVTTGNGNTALGFKAANGMTSGSNNIFIGSLINGSSATASNELNIGNAIFGNLANGNIGIGIQDPNNFKLQVVGNIGPQTDSTYDLGSSTIRWANVFADNFNGAAANITTINNTTINSTTGNIDTINSTNINNSVTITSNSFNGVMANISGTVNGAIFDGDFTNGSILFSNAAGEIVENNSALFWSSTTERLGIGTNDPSQSIDTTGQLRIRGGNPAKDKVLAALDTAGNGTWMDISTILTNGGAFLDALNDAISDKNYNLFLGNGAGLDATGIRNTGVGIHALHAVNIGNGNTAFGFSALNQLTNGHSNLAIGDQAGVGMIGGNGNIFIGNVNGSSATASDELNIGDAIFGNLVNGNIGIGIQDPNNFKLQVVGNIGPQTNSTYDLGSSTIRWANVFADNFNGAAANITTINSTTINNDATITSNNFNGVTANISGTVNGTTFDGDFSNGALLFSDASGQITENTSMLYLDRTNDRLGIGTNNPIGFMLDMNGSVGPHRDLAYNLGSSTRYWDRL
ncbi:MAG: hypothetical protein LW817_06830, partial [Candidatus Caenarcaniphilales bacterium]|nr:hypothetical protein [Candidatus Caenarcaniphilales bacterium]